MRKTLLLFVVLALVGAGSMGQGEWQLVNPLPTGQDFYGQFFLDANTGYLVGINGNIFKTGDGGNTWNSLESGTTETLLSVCFPDASTGYASGEHGTILKTTNGGLAWESLSSGTDAYLSSVDFPEPNTGYAVGYGGTILKTTDGGASWASQSSGTPQW